MATFARMILTLTILLNSVQLFPDTLTIPKVGFVVRYDTRLGLPVMTDYVLPRSMLRRVTSRKGIDFYPDMALPAPQVRPSCYTRTGYDRGHNVPAADRMCSGEMLIETFSMANISPQTPKFNRREWKRVENLVRSLARRYGRIRVITIPMFVYPDTLWLPCRHVAVPDGYRKKVYCWPTNRLILDTILWQRRKPQEGFVTTTP